MKRFLTVLLIFCVVLMAGCEKDDVTTPTPKNNPTPKPEPQKQQKALLIIDNYTIHKLTILDNSQKPSKEIVKLEPFQIYQFIVPVAKCNLEAKSEENEVSIKLENEIKDKAIYIWDLSKSSHYVSLLLSPDGIQEGQEYSDNKDGFYKTDAQISLLQPMQQLSTSVVRLFKDMPEQVPMTLSYANKIAYEMPQAFTLKTLERVVKTIAGDLEGRELEEKIYPLFQSQLPSLYVPAADILAKRGSEKLGEIFMEMINKGWIRSQTNLKRIMAIHIIAGCSGVEALKKLWEDNLDDGRNFIFNALTQTDLDASVEFIKHIMETDDERFKLPAFNYLTLTDFIYKPGVYEIIRKYAIDYDHKNPQYELLKLVIANSSSVLDKFDEDHQIEILLDNLKYPDMSMMRFGLQNIILKHDDKGLKAFTSEYLSLTDQIRKEAVNQIIYKYNKKPQNKNFIDFLKLVVEEDTIEERFKALTALSDPVVQNFDTSLRKFLVGIVENEPDQTKGRVRSIVDKGYAEYLSAKTFTKDIELELKKLVKTGAIDASIIAYNCLEEKLEERDFGDFIKILKTDFDKYPINNQCVLVDKFAKEFTDDDAKKFLIITLKNQNNRVRIVAFDRLIDNPKFANDASILKILNEALEAEVQPEVKKYFEKKLILHKINSGILNGFTEELLGLIDKVLNSEDDELIIKIIEIIQGFEDDELVKIIIKNFEKLSEKSRVHVVDFMARYKDIDFTWIEKTATDKSPAIRQAVFFALLGRIKSFKEDRSRMLCETMIGNEEKEALKNRFEKALSEIK